MKTIPIRPLMTPKLLSLAVLAVLCLLLSSCNRWVGLKGNGRITTEDRQIQN